MKRKRPEVVEKGGRRGAFSGFLKPFDFFSDCKKAVADAFFLKLAARYSKLFNGEFRHLLQNLALETEHRILIREMHRDRFGNAIAEYSKKLAMNGRPERDMRRIAYGIAERIFNNGE